MIEKLIKNTRSYRRFFQNKKVTIKILKELINLARYSASAANRQPLKYIISNQEETNNNIFPTLSWAGYIKDWSGPKEGEKPSSYIIMLADTDISENYWCDPGIAAQNILLGATEKELGGCILGAIDKDTLRKNLNIEERYKILYVIALGKPKEKVEIEETNSEGNIKYWRDDHGVHHVPKRKLEDIIIKQN